MHPNRTPVAARFATLAIVVAACAVGGCSSGPAASMGQLAPVDAVQLDRPDSELALGAGDGLGRIVYVNDVILALGGKPSEFWAMQAVEIHALEGAAIAKLPNKLQISPDDGAFATVPDVTSPAE